MRIERWLDGGGYDDVRAASSVAYVLMSLLFSFFWPALWIITVASAAVASYLVIKRIHAGRIRYRLQNRICLKCGYDCRSSEDNCPECGNPLPLYPAPITITNFRRHRRIDRQ